MLFQELTAIISDHPLVESATFCLRYRGIKDHSKSEVIYVSVKPTKLRNAIWDLETAGRGTLCNFDLHPAKRFFFGGRLEWFGRFIVEFDDGLMVKSIGIGHDEITSPLQAI